MSSNETVHTFAILAPVPLEHLQSGAVVAAKQPFVAYGTNKWKFLNEGEKERAGKPVQMLLYASHEGMEADPSCVVAWTGRYVGRSDPNNAGRHPDKSKRPSTTESDSKWHAFWHIEDLRELPKGDQISIGKLSSVKGGWRKEAPPRGPERVAYVSTL